MNLKKQPTLEKISPEFGSSFFAKRNDVYTGNNKPFWHFHPEMELVYVNKGKGKRHIGNHLSYFNNSQLLLLGSNLPHNGFTDRFSTNGKEIVIQFRPDFLGTGFFTLPEMESIRKLFELSKKGILFGIETKTNLGSKIDTIIDKKGFEKILTLLEVLDGLASTKDFKLLNADGYTYELKPQDSKKIDKIFNYVNDNFKEHVTLKEIAGIVGMTVPAFCRYLKKVTDKTFTRILNEYRVVNATKLLLESELGITDIAFECGYNNFSHFNKMFKEITGKSASKYRNEMTHIITDLKPQA